MFNVMVKCPVTATDPAGKPIDLESLRTRLQRSKGRPDAIVGLICSVVPNAEVKIAGVEVN